MPERHFIGITPSPPSDGADDLVPDRPTQHPWVWMVYVVLFAAAVPWYLPASAASATMLGLPLWVTVSLGATLGVALFTVFVIHRYWSDDA